MYTKDLRIYTSLNANDFHDVFGFADASSVGDDDRQPSDIERKL